MRLYKMFGVWMFENQIEEGEEDEVIFERDNKEYWFTLQEGIESLQWWSFSIARASNKIKLFSCMLCNGASNVKPLISINRVFGLI